MRLVAGVDGGGTHMRALIVDEACRELGRAEVAGAVVRADASGDAVRAVSEAVHAAAEVAGVTLPVSGLWAGLAGAGSPARGRPVERELGAAGLAQDVVVGSDVEAAFHHAFGEGPGILLLAGTGSVACGRGPGGEIVRVGGWGERLGDEGSGFAIGRDAVRSVVRVEDGRGPPTRLARDVLAHLGLADGEELVAWTTTATKGDVAALVPLVAAAADDPVAAEIFVRATTDLSEHVAAVLERAGPWPEPPELVLWGGLLQRDGTLRERVASAVRSLAVRLVERDVDPAMGAAKLALASLR